MVRALALQARGHWFESISPDHIMIRKRCMNMKKSYNELEIYAERKYIIHEHCGHRIRAFYWRLKYKYYQKKSEQEFNK